MDEVILFTHKSFLDAVVKDLEKVYPRRRYTSSSKIEEIMEKEGQLSVIDYIKNKYLQRK